MTLYARFDGAADPAPVTGWYDTEAFDYPDLPDAASLLEMAPAQWDARTAGLWAVSGGALVPYDPPPPVPSLAQQAGAALSAGLALTSPTIPLAGALFDCGADAQAHVNAEVTALLLSGGFADGAQSVAWPDLSGTVHALDVPQFKAFASAIGAYVAALYKVQNGTLAALPPPAAAIA